MILGGLRGLGGGKRVGRGGGVVGRRGVGFVMSVGRRRKGGWC